VLFIARVLLISVLSIVFMPSIFARTQQLNLAKTDLAEKHYLQTLFYYFQGQNETALTEVGRTQLRLGELDKKTSLLKAGLQISIGLQAQAQQVLLAFDHKNTANENIQELLLVALLSLAEQFIEQGKMAEAQDALSNILRVDSRYYSQYTMLSQLAYWPTKTNLLKMSTDKLEKNNENVNADALFSPYIQLNNALRHIENKEYQQAINLLNVLKVSSWFSAEPTFWQTLFSKKLLFGAKEYGANEDNRYTESISQGKQSLAINDYARLLLAQIYVQKALFEKALSELQTFPQHSPYRESALYLFAYSAQQSKHYTSAFNIFTLLHKQYPYSYLGWQSGELLAEQISKQQSLNQGLQAYQQLEEFYQQRVTELSSFSLQPFKFQNEAQSIWLEQALKEPSLSNLYQDLAQTNALSKTIKKLQDKSHWLAETIALNQQRKANVVTSQKNNKQQVQLNLLLTKRTALAEKLSIALASEVALSHGETHETSWRDGFANDNEQAWLNRINKSKENLIYLKKKYAIDDKNQQQSIKDYQQRLNRVEGALNWQLYQKFPQRSWHHKQALKIIDQSLARVKNQQSKILILSESQSSLAIIIEKQLKSAATAQRLLQKTQHLHAQIIKEITDNIAGYINKQQHILAQHILSTKRAMAKILEHIASNDLKIEQQLELSPKHQVDNRFTISNKEVIR